jgi:hypothetical protein
MDLHLKAWPKSDTELLMARSTARPAQPLHLPEIRCRYLKTINKLPGVLTEPE